MDYLSGIIKIGESCPRPFSAQVWLGLGISAVAIFLTLAYFKMWYEETDGQTEIET
jgi:hypothetical protein